MDIKTGETISMIKNLGSVEGIEKGYEKYCEVRPEMFDFPKEIIVGEKGLVGFSKDNPIMCSSISIIYYYINNMLTLHGEPLKFVSQSLVGARMDRMKISYMSGYEERFVELYFNGYAKKDSWAVPKGFRLGEMIGS